MNPDRIVITKEQLATRVAELANQIAARYRDSSEPLVIVTVLNGAVIFLADLIRGLPMRMKLGLIGVSSYRGVAVASRGARITSRLDPELDLCGQPVLIVDDILDTGGTLRLVQQEVAARGPASIETAVLLRKPGKAPDDIRVQYVGFDVDDEFVVGYGLDYDGQYRNLPYIGVLEVGD